LSQLNVSMKSPATTPVTMAAPKITGF
jgi:hypothetical protein